MVENWVGEERFAGAFDDADLKENERMEMCWGNHSFHPEPSQPFSPLAMFLYWILKIALLSHNSHNLSSVYFTRSIAPLNHARPTRRQPRAKLKTWERINKFCWGSGRQTQRRKKEWRLWNNHSFHPEPSQPRFSYIDDCVTPKKGGEDWVVV